MPKRKSSEVEKSPSSASKRKKSASSQDRVNEKKTTSAKKKPSSGKVSSPSKSPSPSRKRSSSSPKKSTSTKKSASSKGVSTKQDDASASSDEEQVSASKQKKTYPKLVDPATNKETVRWGSKVKKQDQDLNFTLHALIYVQKLHLRSSQVHFPKKNALYWLFMCLHSQSHLNLFLYMYTYMYYMYFISKNYFILLEYWQNSFTVNNTFFHLFIGF